MVGKGSTCFCYDSPGSRRLISASESVVAAAASQLRRTDEEQRSTTREPHRPEYRSRGAVSPPLPGHLLTSVLTCNQAVHLPATAEIVGRFGGKFEVEGGRAGPGGKVDAPELSSGPGWEIQEVSRVGAQGVTSKSKLLAREMPRVCSRGLRVDSEAAKSLKVAPAQSGPKSMRRSSPRDL